LFTDKMKDQASKFYENVGTVAQSRGINVSVISIKGTDCKIENLGQVADQTNGAVDRVNPLEISKNFQSILSLPVIATSVSATVLLHNGMFIRSSENEKSVEIIDVGPVTKESVMSFEYGLRPSLKKDFANVQSLPFQVQISYVRADGMKCLRVISKKQPVTFDKQVAEQKANIPVLATNASHQSAKMATEGHYTKARQYNFASKNMLDRAATTETQKKQVSKWTDYGAQFENEMLQVQQKELDEGMDLNEDEDDDEGDKESVPSEKKKSKKDSKTSKVRANQRNDTTATFLYQMKSAPMSKFK